MGQLPLSWYPATCMGRVNPFVATQAPTKPRRLTLISKPPGLEKPCDLLDQVRLYGSFSGVNVGTAAHSALNAATTDVILPHNSSRDLLCLVHLVSVLWSMFLAARLFPSSISVSQSWGTEVIDREWLERHTGYITAPSAVQYLYKAWLTIYLLVLIIRGLWSTLGFIPDGRCPRLSAIFAGRVEPALAVDAEN